LEEVEKVDSVDDPPAHASSAGADDGGLLVPYLQMIDICEQLQLPYTLVSGALRVYSEFVRSPAERPRGTPEVLVRALNNGTIVPDPDGTALQAAAALVAAVREVGKPVSMAEIAAAAKLQPKDVGKFTKCVCPCERCAPARLMCKDRVMGAVPPDASSAITEYMKRYCKEMDLGEAVSLVAMGIADRAAHSDLTKRNPRTLCAAIMCGATPRVWIWLSDCACSYLVCQLEDVKRTQAEVSRVANVTEVTLRKVYKDITSHLPALLPDAYSPRIPVDCVLGRVRVGPGGGQIASVAAAAAAAAPTASAAGAPAFASAAPFAAAAAVAVAAGPSDPAPLVRPTAQAAAGDGEGETRAPPVETQTPDCP
jgi:transcription initiation factor TFIIIB Brf1 subunit/transcription initiation factor TFIIB